METFDLKSFFKKIGYDWRKDVFQIEEICRLTKTRVMNPKPESMLRAGMEQAFVLKSIADYKKSKRFFEIGTGRGTGSFSVALSQTIDYITTVDIVPFEQKSNTAIEYEQAYASNADLFYLVPFEEKNKINFVMRHEATRDSDCDLAFIDGDHTNPSIIVEDFEMVEHILDDGGVILWDDYDPNQFVVKRVIEKICDKIDVELILVEFRGHLFSGMEPEDGSGEIIMTKGGFFNE